ncbi:MAG: TIGR02996 domain-containing protein [Kofleriaceae bacterium]
MNAEELVAAIVATPEAEEAWIFYADWLLDRGHPRGELIYLQAAADGGDVDAINRLRRLEDDEEPLLSPRLAAKARHWKFDWRRGFIQRAALRRDEGEPDAEMLAALCADPHVALLSGLTIDHVDGACTLGNLDAELARLRRLDVLCLGGVNLASLRHANLRVLHIEDAHCPPVLDGNFDLPRLERLIWDLSDPALLGIPTSIAHAPPPSLACLELPFATADTIASLASSPLARQLQALDFGTYGSKTIAAMCDHATAFPNVRKLRITSPRRRLRLHLGALDLAAVRDEVWADEKTISGLVDDLRRRLPTTELDTEMFFVPRPSRSPRPERPHVQFDAESRGPDGRIDALGKWISESRRR